MLELHSCPSSAECVLKFKKNKKSINSVEKKCAFWLEMNSVEKTCFMGCNEPCIEEMCSLA